MPLPHRISTLNQYFFILSWQRQSDSPAPKTNKMLDF